MSIVALAPDLDFETQTGGSQLDVFFRPSSVALIGATEREGTGGRVVLGDLLKNHTKIYAVNPSHATVLGHKAYASVGDIGEPVDLAVIVTPAASVPNVVRECAAARVKGAVIISAGFRERGAAGAELEREILA